MELYGACPLFKVFQKSCHDLDTRKEMMKGPLGQKIVTKENTKKNRIEDQIVAKQNSRFRWIWENANLQLARGLKMFKAR